MALNGTTLNPDRNNDLREGTPNVREYVRLRDDLAARIAAQRSAATHPPPPVTAREYVIWAKSVPKRFKKPRRSRARGAIHPC